MGWKGRKRKGGRVGGREGERGEDVEGPGKWSAPGPVLALGGPGGEEKREGKGKAIKTPLLNGMATGLLPGSFLVQIWTSSEWVTSPLQSRPRQDPLST